MTSLLLQETILRNSRQTPHSAAIIGGSEVIGFNELKRRADELAATLKARGVVAGDRVAIYMPKGVDAVIAVYGVLLAKAVYVPLDSRSPALRLSAVVEDSDCAALITTAALAERTVLVRELSERGLPLICLPLQTSSNVRSNVLEDSADLTESSTAAMEISDEEAAPAAILYTSGSTGSPRGVVVTHGGLMHFASWTSRFFLMNSNDRVAGIAPLQFDLSTFDLFATHLAGAALVMPDEKAILFPRAMVQMFIRHGVTICYAVPTFWMMILDRGGLAAEGLPALRHVMFAGEVFPLPQLRRLMMLLPAAKFTNLFGPLETNVCTLHSLSEIPSEEMVEIPIGVACPETTLCVVDENGSPVEPGEIGELVVTGPSVTPGYWRNHNLTQEKRWRGDQFSFKTGDLVTMAPNGQLLFRGRRDHQVKIRGYRVELHEIEQVLNQHSGVAQAVAVLCRNRTGEDCIATVVVRHSEQVTADLLRDFVAARLPPSSQPEQFMFLEQLPQTNTGKTDRRQLQAAIKQLLAE